MFSVLTTPEELKNATARHRQFWICVWGLWAKPRSGKSLVYLSWFHRCWKTSFSKYFPSTVNEKPVFSNLSVWRVFSGVWTVSDICRLQTTDCNRGPQTVDYTEEKITDDRWPQILQTGQSLIRHKSLSYWNYTLWSRKRRYGHGMCWQWNFPRRHTDMR